jgi:hypothetical protein
MITVKTNIGKVVEVIIHQLKDVADTDKMLRTAATTVLGLMKKRIHEDGLDATGKRIGTYSPGYMKIRTGDFGNSAKVSRGKNIGKLKDAGVFTDKTIRLNKKAGVFTGEEKVGKARPRYNRTSDTKVVLSLTREMENDMKVSSPIKTKLGYGIGYSNKDNYDKSQWVEATYNLKGKIFSLSEEEEKAVIAIAEKYTQDALFG